MRGRVDVRGIDQEGRLGILRLLRERYGFKRLASMLAISRPSLYRYLRGMRRIPDSVVERCLEYIDEHELTGLLTARERLRAMGFVRDDGSLDYSLVLEVVRYAFRDEYLKQVILQTIAREFRDDLRRMFGAGFSGVVLKWSKDFEYFLRNVKRRRRITAEETMSYYRNIFKKHLEGREIDMELVEWVSRHENGWLRNIFRHYVQYLYFRRVITPEAMGWLLLVVPSRSYKMDPRPYRITYEDVIRTFSHLKRKNERLYAIYRFMLESGTRFIHTLRIFHQWYPDDEVEVPGIGYTKRLVVFEDRGFVRYYAGFRQQLKKCEWTYISLDTLRLLEKYSGKRYDRNAVTRYANRNGVLQPKYMRKLAWRMMVKMLGREVSRFLHARFGELTVSETRYEDLLSEADELYPKYLAELDKQIYSKLG